MALPEVPALILIGGDGGYSGVPTYIAQVLRALKGRAQITVLSDVNRGGYDFVASSGAQHIEMHGLRTTLNPLTWLRAARHLSALLRAHNQAVIWAHARMAVLLVRLLLVTGLFKPEQPVLVTYHGLSFDPGHRPGLAQLSRWIEAVSLRHSPPHDLIFLSAAARDRFQAAIGADICARHRLSVLTNCSDLGPLPPAPAATEGLTIVMTGRAGHQKNFEAAARIFTHLPGCYHLVLCGAGTDHPKMRALFARHLTPAAMTRVTFSGPIADVRPQLAAADCYLMTSRYEGMPIGALEAFEAGLPLALSNITGTDEIRAAHPLALALDFKDPAAEANALDALIKEYLGDRAAYTAAIQSRWAGQFSYPTWERDMQTLWDRIQSPLP